MIEVKNYTLFEHVGGGKKYKKIVDENGQEKGIELSGLLTTYDVTNENGMRFTHNSYDEGLKRYFIENNLNVPVCLLHDDRNITHLCGTVKEMKSTDEGVRITVFIPQSSYNYKVIKNYIDNGILQGFSNCGFAREAEWDEERNTLVIKDFDLLHVALVATPADTGAGFEAAATRFAGFGKTIEKNKVKKEKLNYFNYL